MPRIYTAFDVHAGGWHQLVQDLIAISTDDPALRLKFYQGVYAVGKSLIGGTIGNEIFEGNQYPAEWRGGLEAGIRPNYSGTSQSMSIRLETGYANTLQSGGVPLDLSRAKIEQWISSKLHFESIISARRLTMADTFMQRRGRGQPRGRRLTELADPKGKVVSLIMNKIASVGVNPQPILQTALGPGTQFPEAIRRLAGIYLDEKITKGSHGRIHRGSA